jgi:hypothetical protein
MIARISRATGEESSCFINHNRSDHPEWLTRGALKIQDFSVGAVPTLEPLPGLPVFSATIGEAMDLYAGGPAGVTIRFILHGSPDLTRIMPPSTEGAPYRDQTDLSSRFDPSPFEARLRRAPEVAVLGRVDISRIPAATAFRQRFGPITLNRVT